MLLLRVQNDMIKPAIKGVLNVLKACAKAKEVKRVILTSSAAAVTINELKGEGHVMDEANWSDVKFLNSAKPPTWVKIELYSKEKIILTQNGMKIFDNNLNG